MRTCEIGAGIEVSEAARILVRNANDAQEPCTADFNRIPLVAFPGDNAAKVEAAWRSESKRRAEVYYASDEYKASEARRTAKNAHFQQLADEHLASLPSLDVSSHTEVINWLERLLELANGGNSTIPWPTVVSALQAGGYEMNANCGVDYNPDDADNSARWLIGQYMSVVDDNGLAMNALNNIFGNFAQEWRDKFATTS